MPGPMNYVGGEEGKIDGGNFPGWSGFTDKAIRAVFVRKVNCCATQNNQYLTLKIRKLKMFIFCRYMLY